MSADDNAPEQAREVPLVADILLDDVGLPLADRSRNLAGAQATLKAIATAERVLAALAPIRAAERQEAARAELLAAAKDLPDCTEGAGRVGTQWWPECDRDAYSIAIEEAVSVLRDRADGVTGRSGT